MLKITVSPPELWDEEKEEFIPAKEGVVLQLEHSLVSLSKWESKWGKAFLSQREKTFEETVDYVRCMTLTQNVKPDVYRNLTNENLSQIYAYINAPMTATCFFDDKDKPSGREVYTAEIIYYQMVALNIPFECQKWHLNRLLTLIRVCNIKNAPPKKRSRREIMKRHAALNAARKKRYNTRG